MTIVQEMKGILALISIAAIILVGISWAVNKLLEEEKSKQWYEQDKKKKR